MGYSKLHSSLVNSSLWCERDDVRILFITMLALANRDGHIYGSRAGIFRQANITFSDDAKDPFEQLMDADPDSSDILRNPENEGRRIREIPGGFEIINYPYYRGLRNDDDRREQNRIAQEKFRIKHKKDKPASARISHGNPRSSHAEADAISKEQKADTKKKSTPLPPFRGDIDAYFVELDLPITEATRFLDYYASNGWKVGKNPMKDWKAAARGWKTRYIERGKSHAPQPCREQGKSMWGKLAAPLYEKAKDLGPDLTDEQKEKNRQFAAEMVRQVRKTRQAEPES